MRPTTNQSQRPHDVGNDNKRPDNDESYRASTGRFVPADCDCSKCTESEEDDCLCHQNQNFLEALEEAEQKEFLEEMISPHLHTMFVTPKDVDETVKYLSFTISEGLNMAFEEIGG